MTYVSAFVPPLSSCLYISIYMVYCIYVSIISCDIPTSIASAASRGNSIVCDSRSTRIAARSCNTSTCSRVLIVVIARLIFRKTGSCDPREALLIHILPIIIIFARRTPLRYGAHPAFPRRSSATKENRQRPSRRDCRIRSPVARCWRPPNVAASRKAIEYR